MDSSGGETWLTYRELGARLGCSPNAARMFAMRRGWQRQRPNRIGEAARVLVPQELRGAAKFQGALHVAEQSNARANGMDIHNEAAEPYSQAVAQAIATLAAQLEHERARADSLTATIAQQQETIRRLIELSSRSSRWRRWFR